MFAAIASRYDLLNHLLSLNVDRWWRRFTVGRLRPYLDSSPLLALDLCCGTGDLALELARFVERTRKVSVSVIGVDFCRPMLRIGQEKIARRRASVSLVEGDALRLPFPNDLFSVVTIAFGLRNLESPARGLREIYRVLRPGGAAAILEFSRPSVPLFRQLFEFYFQKLLPRLGAWISGVPGPYEYLRDSVHAFLSPPEVARLMEETGFSAVRFVPLTGGIATLHVGEKKR